jgi:isomerase DpgB
MVTTDLKSWLGDRAGIYLQIDGGRPLSEELIASVVDVCDRIEASTSEAIVVLHVTEDPSVDREAKAWPGQVGIHLVNKWERTLRRLERLPSAIITAAEGACGGPALEIMLSADYRIGTADLSVRLAVNAGQVWPSMAVHRLTTQIGVARARQLVLFGIDVTAEQAERLGLVDELTTSVVDAIVYATKLVSGLAGSELAVRRRLLLDASTTSFEESLGAHLAACDRMLRRIAS